MPKRKREDGLYKRGDSPYIWASFTDASGTRVRRSTGTSDQKEAEAILAKWKLTTHQQRVWGEEPERLFDDLMVRYLQATQEQKRSAERDLYITVNLKMFFAGRSMNALCADDVHEYTRWRREAHKRDESQSGTLEESTHRTARKRGYRGRPRPVADSTIRRELSLLSAAINFARREWTWKIPNPVEERKPRHGDDRIRWLKPEEANQLLAAAARDPRANSHLPDFIELGLHTGCRSQEMLGLEWSRVDLDQRLIYLPASKNKGKRHLSVPLNETAYRVLRRRSEFRKSHCPKSPWVFCTKEGERIASVKKSFATACTRAGISDFRPDDLRHTCAAWLVQAGVPIMQVRDLLRHTTVQVTEKYAHLAPENVRGAVDVLDRVFVGRNVGADEPAVEPPAAVTNGDTSRSGHARRHLLRVLPNNSRYLLIVLM